MDVIDTAEQAELPPALQQRLTQTQLRQRAVQGLDGVLQVQVPEHGAGVLCQRHGPRAASRNHVFLKFGPHRVGRLGGSAPANA